MTLHVESADSYWAVSAEEDDFGKLEPELARTLGRCGTCHTYRITSLEYIRLKYVPLRFAISFVFDTDVTLVSGRLLTLLEGVADACDTWEASKLQHRGVEAWAFRSAFRYQVRGTDNVSYFLCPECGLESYVGFGDRYLVGPIDRSISIFQSGPGELLVSEFIAAQLRSSEIPGLSYERIPVVGRPLDQYPPVLASERRLLR